MGGAATALLLWIGCKRLLAIELVAVVLPATVFGLWTNIVSGSGCDFGMNVATDRMFLEHVLLATVMLALLVSLAL